MDKEKIVAIVTKIVDAYAVSEDSVATATGVEGGVFLVEVLCKGVGDEIEVVADADGEASRSLGIDSCAALSREINAALYVEFGEDAEFSLTVMSAGVGQPLKLGRQYRKLMASGSALVDVLFKDGRKLAGTKLMDIHTAAGADIPEFIAVEYEVKELLPGPKKKKGLVTKQERILLAEVKSVCEHLAFK